ncbi:MFS transporter [Streptacidiphilus fuscans]|uniref:MFS transporter n=1 Tax=Streptacidiphilus fuscans TaxID=2789292 RepID=A0A931B7F4_9ACTN|nr:MFS transporter [Streptacidiphilus fuscans]MBF9071814.1 MFS transporter [Streptacidiphilus fuscans]
MPRHVRPTPTIASRPRRTGKTSASQGRRWLLDCYLLRTTDALASAVMAYAVPLIVLQLTGSAALTGTAFGIEWLPRIAAILGAGPLIDRHTPQTTAFTAAALRTIATATTVIAVALGAGAPAVLAYAVIGGILTQAGYLATESLTSEATRHAGPDGHKIQATTTAIDQATQLAGPVLAGLLLWCSPTVLLTAVTVLCAMTALQTLLLTDAHPRPRLRLVTDQPTPNLVRQLAAGTRTVARIPALAWLLAALAAGNLVSGVLQVATPILTTQRFHHTPEATTGIWTASALASLLAVSVARRAVTRLGLFRTGAVAATIASITALGAGAAPTFSLYAAAVTLMMAAEGALLVVLRTGRARLIPAAGFSATLSATVAMILIPLPIAGALVASIAAPHLQLVVIAAAGAQALVAGACFTGLARHRAALDESPEPLPASAPSASPSTAFEDRDAA